LCPSPTRSHNGNQAGKVDGLATIYHDAAIEILEPKTRECMMKERFWPVVWGVVLWISLFFSGLFSWLTPLPLIYVGHRYSLRSAMLGWLIATSLLVGFYQVIFYYFLHSSLTGEKIGGFAWLPGMGYYELFGRGAVLGALLTYSVFLGSLSLILVWKSRQTKTVISLASWVVGGASAITFLVILGLVKGNLTGFVTGITRYLGWVLDQFITLNQSAGLNGEEITFLQKNRENILGFFLRILPGVLWVSVLFLVWLNLVVAKRIFGALSFLGKGKFQDLHTFRMPFVFVWGVILVLSLYLTNTYFWHREWLEFVLLNFFLAVLILYFFQGLAIFSFYLVFKGVTPWMRFFCYFLLLIFFQPLGIVLVMLGFFDSWFNFRKLKMGEIGDRS
jgi:uncharacterized protein YybS (DUF2232 family)